MIISVIAAVAANGVIGHEGKMPWHLPNDLKRFRSVTIGKPIIMGRKTYESLGKALPDRTNIVVSRDLTLKLPDALVACSVESAISGASVAGYEEIFVIGGAEIYKQVLPLANWLYLTKVECQIEGDTHFPEYTKEDWSWVMAESRPADEKNKYGITFELYRRSI